MRLIILIIVLQTYVYCQVPSINTRSYPTPISIEAEEHHFDMIANELGIHYVYDSSQCIVHSLISHNGKVLSRSIVACALSTNAVLSVCSIVESNIEMLYIAYRNADSIEIRQSSNGGEVWVKPINSTISAMDDTVSNRISIAGTESNLHVTWDIAEVPRCFTQAS